MSKWILKTAVQRAISCLPRSHRFNELFQTYVTRGLDLTPIRFEAKLRCCQTHFDNYRRFCPAPKEHFTVLELGTGWFPIIPIGLFLSGAAEIWTFDIVPLVRRKHLQKVLQAFVDDARNGRIAQFLPSLREHRIAALRDVLHNVDQGQPAGAALESLNIHLQVKDARRTGLPAGAIDFIFSNTVLEHIPARMIAELFAEFHRVAASGAVMSHHIGLADQFACFDHSITPFNFLRYPASRWRWLNNPVIPLNRLRISDYRALFRQTGYTILDEQNTVGNVEDLRAVPLAPEFRAYAVEDLLVLYSWIVARRSQAPGSAHAVADA